MFSGRGAFVQLGALIGTAMVANVAMIIIPNQRKVVAALMAGHAPDPKLGAEGKQRSLHNNYLTLPVLFLMLANHYPLSFATQWNWVIAALVLVIGGVIRHFYNVRPCGGASPWWTWAVAAFCMIVDHVAVGARTSRHVCGNVNACRLREEPSICRCAGHHHRALLDVSREGTGLGRHRFAAQGRPVGQPETIRLHAREIALQTVHTHAMPPGGNITDLSDDDRRIIAVWLAAGAPAN